MAATLVGSESISGRSNLLTGANPLQLDSWCDLLVPDLYIKICERLGCAPMEETDEVNVALQQSLSQGSSQLSIDQITNKSKLIETSLHGPVARQWFVTIGDHVADSVLTPIKTREKIRNEEIVAGHPTIFTVRRSVRDLQYIVAYELALIAAGAFRVDTPLSGRVLSRNALAPQTVTLYMFFGEAYAKQAFWQNALEVRGNIGILLLY